MLSVRVNWFGSYLELNDVGREKRCAFFARHSNTPRARHPSHSCIFGSISCCCSVMPGHGGSIQPWLFHLAQSFTGMGFLTFPSMKVSLPLNQMLALVARGLCDSQVVMMF